MVQAEGVWGVVHRVGNVVQVREWKGRGDPPSVWTPPSEVYHRVGIRPAWSWGPVGSRLPSPGTKRWEGPHGIDRGRGLERPARSDPCYREWGRDGWKMGRGEVVGKDRTRRIEKGVVGSGRG